MTSDKCSDDDQNAFTQEPTSLTIEGMATTHQNAIMFQAGRQKAAV